MARSGSSSALRVKAFAVVTGTAANSLSLATLSPPYGAIYAHEEAHILNDECGAPEFFSNGARLVVCGGPNGKLTAETLGEALDAHPVSVHSNQPAAVSITQATEVGTAYRPDEIAAITELAHRRKLGVHMDGARFANAVEFLGCSPADVTWRAGVDVLSFGATKNGALAAEAVVFFNLDLVRDFELRRKAGGPPDLEVALSSRHSCWLISKMVSGAETPAAPTASLVVSAAPRARP